MIILVVTGILGRGTTQSLPTCFQAKVEINSKEMYSASFLLDVRGPQIFSRWWFQIFCLCSPLFREDSNFDYITSFFANMSNVFGFLPVV